MEGVGVCVCVVHNISQPLQRITVSSENISVLHYFIRLPLITFHFILLVLI